MSAIKYNQNSDTYKFFRKKKLQAAWKHNQQQTYVFIITMLQVHSFFNQRRCVRLVWCLIQTLENNFKTHDMCFSYLSFFDKILNNDKKSCFVQNGNSKTSFIWFPESKDFIMSRIIFFLLKRGFLIFKGHSYFFIRKRI